jgi:TolA-binding protein
VAEALKGYQDIPEEDRKKAKVFFDRGNTVAGTGNYDYAISMYLSGLEIDPENVEAHQTLRDISLKRKASGGKDMGMFEKMKVKTTRDDKQNMLGAEKLLAYDPGNTDRMVQILQNAHRAGFYDTVMWIGAILMKANAEGKSPDYNKFITLKDVYKSIEQWKLATECAYHALQLRPDNMELHTELKNLGALDTMKGGNYGTSKSFRDSIRDMDKQHKFHESDKDIRSVDSLQQAITDAETEFKADPNEPGKLNKLVDALLRTERAEEENRAIELLDEAYQRSKQFRWRQKIGQIKIAQYNRMDRSLRDDLRVDPTDADLKQRYVEFSREKAELELGELTLWVENYPTDTRYRFEMAKRLFALSRFDEAIPVFQHVRNDPKYRGEAALYLGRAFLESGYLDEASDTLRGVIEDYQLKGDEKSKDMYYWYGRTLEQKGDLAAALKSYSQLAQWDFNYRDVQGRVKALRAAPKPT